MEEGSTANVLLILLRVHTKTDNTHVSYPKTHIFLVQKTHVFIENTHKFQGQKAHVFSGQIVCFSRRQMYAFLGQKIDAILWDRKHIFRLQSTHISTRVNTFISRTENTHTFKATRHTHL